MTSFDPKAFGSKLRAAREELELTQTEMSRRSVRLDDPTDRISTPYISALERGERNHRPSEQILAAIARGLRHSDAYTVREWAGIERDPDWSTTLRALKVDRALSPKDRELLSHLYLRLAGQGA